MASPKRLNKIVLEVFAASGTCRLQANFIYVIYLKDNRL